MTLFQYTLEGPTGTSATLGLVVLQSDETIEHDLRCIFTAPNISLYVIRFPSGLDVSRETLATMSAALPDAAKLLPRALHYDVVGYGCTSAASMIGPEKVTEQVKAGCSTTQVTEPLSALVTIYKDRDISRIAYLSPYIETVSQTLRDAMNARGIETPIFGPFDEGEETKVAKISQQSLYDAAMALGASDIVEAVFMSCTNLRTLDVIPKIEKALGKPVFSSNHLLAWHMAKLAGVDLIQPRTQPAQHINTSR